MLTASCLELTRVPRAPPFGITRSAIADAKALGWNTRFCGETVAACVPPAAMDQYVITALSASAAVTFWSGPEVMIDGVMLRVGVVPVTSAVRENDCRMPVDSLLSG